jgi:hypothetical protein
MRWGRGVALLAVVSVAAAPGGGTPVPRQTGKGVTFSTTRAGTVTGVDFQVHWQNPDQPKTGKPHSVSKVVLHYAPGTVIDTSVPERCTASDPEITAQGADACPPGSKLGGGTLETDNGSSDQTRYVHNTVQVFSNQNDLIFLLETTNPPTRLVAHTTISGSTTTTNVPPTPGFPPPDPSNALKDETLHFPPYVRNGKPYTKTPPTCPSVGYWTNTLVMTYQDGVTEKLASRSPCQLPKPPRASVRLNGVPTNRCASKDFVVRVRISHAPAPRSSKLRLDGKTISSTTRRSFDVPIHVAGLSPGRHQLVGRVSAAGGVKGTKRRTFTRC